MKIIWAQERARCAARNAILVPRAFSAFKMARPSLGTRLGPFSLRHFVWVGITDRRFRATFQESGKYQTLFFEKYHLGEIAEHAANFELYRSGGICKIKLVKRVLPSPAVDK